MILNLTPLPPKKTFTVEFIWIRQVLSNHKIPFQRQKWGNMLKSFKGILEVSKVYLQAEEQGEVVLPMATRPHYASILNEDWDPLDFVGRSLI